jgi:Na+/H+-dicarboxylate symporter
MTRWKKTSNQMLVGMAAGTLLGLVFGPRMVQFKPLGDLFVILLQMSAMPLIFFNIVTAIARLPDLRTMRRMSLLTIGYYTVTMACAAAIGIFVMSVLRVGTGFTLHGVKSPEAGTMLSWPQVILNMFPNNVVNAFAGGRLLQIVIFAIFLGITLVLVKPEDKSRILGLFESFNHVFGKMVALIMSYGPIGVTALLAATVGQYGSTFVGPIGKYVASYYLAAVLQVGLIYMLLTSIVLRINSLHLLGQSLPIITTAASTCSSLATVPVCFRVAAEEMKIPEHVYGFTLPIGAALNKDGSTLIFAAVLTFASNALGLHLSVERIFMMILMSVLISLGGEGIPMAGVMQLAIILPAFGLPVEFVTVFAGIWRITEMPQVALNCIGDIIGTKVVAGFCAGQATHHTKEAGLVVGAIADQTDRSSS